MANENLEEWHTNPAVVNETVLIAKEFLDEELAKYDSWDHADKFISMKDLFDSNSQFENCKKNGVGRATIQKFLGNNWKGWLIQQALSTLKFEREGKIDRDTVEKLPSPSHMCRFHFTIGPNPKVFQVRIY